MLHLQGVQDQYIAQILLKSCKEYSASLVHINDLLHPHVTLHEDTKDVMDMLWYDLHHASCCSACP